MNGSTGLDQVRELGDTIHKTLLQMGSETTTVFAGQPWGGLRVYPELHAKIPGVKRFGDREWELPYWDGLQHRLNIAETPATREKAYPGTGYHCDLVIYPDSDKSIWIEGKALFEYKVSDGVDPYWRQTKLKRDTWKNALHDTRNGQDVSHDLKKLDGLSRQYARYVGDPCLGVRASGRGVRSGVFLCDVASRVDGSQIGGLLPLGKAPPVSRGLSLARPVARR